MSKNHDDELQQLLALAQSLHQEAKSAAVAKPTEDAFMAALAALVSRLSSTDPAALRQALESLTETPLAQAVNRQWLAYYHGLALGLCEAYDAALAAFDALLAMPTIAQRVQARALNSRAVFCRITGRLAEALAGYRASLAIWRRLQDRRNEGKVLTNLGVIAYQLQEYQRAEEELLAAAAAFAQAKDQAGQAAVQNELGLIYRDQGRWAEALDCFAAFADQSRRDNAGDLLGRALNNQGEVLLLQGKPADAIRVFHEALVQMTTRVYRVDLYLNLGLAALANADSAAAQVAFDQARDLAQSIGRRDILAQVYYRLGDLWRQQGEATAAYDALLTAVAVIEATREPIHEEGLKISLLGRWQQIYEALVLLLLEVGRADEALLWTERARARAFAEIVTLRQSKQPVSHASSATHIDNQACFHQACTPDTVIDDQLLTRVQAALPASHAVLCYFTTGVLDRTEPFLRTLAKDHPLRLHLLTPARTLLFVITRDAITVHRCPIDPNAFTSHTRRQDDRTRFFDARVRQSLRQILLPQNVEAHLPLPDQQRLYLIPHGPLHSVPFGLLLAQETVESHPAPAVIQTPSLTLLTHHLARQPIQTADAPDKGKETESLLAIGYNGTRHALRHTETEARLVAALTGGVAWVGADAKVAQLPRRAATVRLLHLACHGWFDYNTPLHSYLETGDGERLTAQGVLDEWRLQADLVVLSACQTGVNRVLRSDEPMGLIRGFLAAGARLVLATSWPVADLPTFLLMSRFYGEIAKRGIGERSDDAAVALLRAQQWLRHLTRAEVKQQMTVLASQLADVAVAEIEQTLPAGEQPFADPRDWAGFVLYAG